MASVPISINHSCRILLTDSCHIGSLAFLQSSNIATHEQRDLARDILAMSIAPRAFLVSSLPLLSRGFALFTFPTLAFHDEEPHRERFAPSEHGRVAGRKQEWTPGRTCGCGAVQHLQRYSGRCYAVCRICVGIPRVRWGCGFGVCRLSSARRMIVRFAPRRHARWQIQTRDEFHKVIKVVIQAQTSVYISQDTHIPSSPRR